MVFVKEERNARQNCVLYKICHLNVLQAIAFERLEQKSENWYLCQKYIEVLRCGNTIETIFSLERGALS